MNIAIESPRQAEIIRLIDALDAYQQPLYPAESHHGVDIATLDRADVVFAVVRDEAGIAIGCGAVRCTPAYGELKRMYIDPAQRGRGIGRALLAFLETQAQGRACRLLRLETGYLQHEALSLYARAGYVRRGPFGDYREDPNSVFMEKALG